MIKKSLVALLVLALIVSLVLNWQHYRQDKVFQRILASHVSNGIGGAASRVNYASYRLAYPSQAATYLQEAQAHITYFWSIYESYSFRYHSERKTQHEQLDLLMFITYYRTELSDMIYIAINGTDAEIGALADSVSSLASELLLLSRVFTSENLLAWKTREQADRAIDDIASSLPTFSKYIRNTRFLK